jgi:hypothetical protein
MNWLLFVGLFLTPAVLTLFAAAKGSEDNAGMISIIASPAAGLCCGRICANARGGSLGFQIAATLLLGVLFTIPIFILCFYGCLHGQSISKHQIIRS